jgi:hypothetical protein
VTEKNQTIPNTDSRSPGQYFDLDIQENETGMLTTWRQRRPVMHHKEIDFRTVIIWLKTMSNVVLCEHSC